MRIEREGAVYEVPGMSPEDAEAGEQAGVLVRVSYMTPPTGRLTIAQALAPPADPPKATRAPRARKG